MDAIDIALKMETDAIDFYTKAADRTDHPVGKKMFLSIADDERRHIEMLNALLKGMHLSHKDVNPMAEIKTVFQQMKDQMQQQVRATTDEIEALTMAMRMEQESYDYYEKMSREAPDPKSRDLFARLVKEEQQHYEIFSNTLSFLTDTGNWFMWEEHSIVDGGTPWA